MPCSATLKHKDPKVAKKICRNDLKRFGRLLAVVFGAVKTNTFFGGLPGLTGQSAGPGSFTKWDLKPGSQKSLGYKDGDFDRDLCPDPLTCAENCHLEGNSKAGLRWMSTQK